MTAIDAAAIKRYAKTLGFDLVGVAPIQPSPEADFYNEWLARGYAGEMHYLERGTAARMDPATLLPGARSVIVCAINYNTDRPRTGVDRLRAWVSRYAWGADYHDTLKQKLDALAQWIETQSPSRTRTYVDTGPVNERVFAKYAGIGWFGKNTCIIEEKIGSWLFLGCVFTDLQLDADSPVPDRCGTCTRCIDACPTDAILEPYVLDSRKCISYTTIELRGEIPEPEREGIGHHLYGCDICQDVCPWNRRAPVSLSEEFQPKPGLFWPEIEGLLNTDDAEWRELIRGSAMRRAKVKGLLRNLMVVAGNSGVKKLAASMEKFLEHADETVRSHARWGIDKLM
ncbi:MAG TPA: tRNA epoxyqueuosine(34) reductase QueG [Terriglobia bacterium]|nr:tRNA epoxyqueuosine(34) reductase QueG [Terriglobia bacterium]